MHLDSTLPVILSCLFSFLFFVGILSFFSNICQIENNKNAHNCFNLNFVWGVLWNVQLHFTRILDLNCFPFNVDDNSTPPYAICHSFRFVYENIAKSTRNENTFRIYNDLQMLRIILSDPCSSHKSKQISNSRCQIKDKFSRELSMKKLTFGPNSQ